MLNTDTSTSTSTSTVDTSTSDRIQEKRDTIAALYEQITSDPMLAPMIDAAESKAASDAAKRLADLRVATALVLRTCAADVTASMTRAAVKGIRAARKAR